MTPAPPAGPDEGPGFIRAGGGVGLDARRVGAVLGLLLLGGLIALTVALWVSDTGANGRIDRLRSEGVPVQLTVTRCLGISSGVGMGIEYWQCRGTYSMGSRTFEEVIGGQRRLLEAGRRITVIAVPGHPSLVSVPAALGHRRSYSLDVGLTVASAVGVVLAAGLLARWRLSGRRP